MTLLSLGTHSPPEKPSIVQNNQKQKPWIAGELVVMAYNDCQLFLLLPIDPSPGRKVRPEEMGLPHTDCYAVIDSGDPMHAQHSPWTWSWKLNGKLEWICKYGPHSAYKSTA